MHSHKLTSHVHYITRDYRVKLTYSFQDYTERRMIVNQLTSVELARSPQLSVVQPNVEHCGASVSER